MSQSQKTLKSMEEETNQLLVATKTLSDKTEKTIDSINKNLELKFNQLKKDLKDAQDKLKEKENLLSQANSSVKELQDQKTKLLDEIRDKNLKIDNLDKQVKELQKKIP